MFLDKICQTLCQFLGNIFQNENLWNMPSNHFLSREDRGSHSKVRQYNKLITVNKLCINAAE